VWAAATVAIPALAIAEVRAWPPALGFQRWATVFPLGMYATATYAFAMRVGAAWLHTLATVFLWVAVPAVAATLGRPRPQSALSKR
jgi:tellurite resistance protein TehA-like permease